jgi:hypothetical protein
MIDLPLLRDGLDVLSRHAVHCFLAVDFFCRIELIIVENSRCTHKCEVLVSLVTDPPRPCGPPRLGGDLLRVELFDPLKMHSPQ